MRLDIAAGTAVRFEPGQAFVEGLKAWDEMAGKQFPQPHILCVSIGHAAGHVGFDLSTTLSAFAQSQISNQLQVAIRLSLIGQTGAARILAKLEPILSKLVLFTSHATLDNLGSAAYNAEIMTMKHQYLPARMFHS